MNNNITNNPLLSLNISILCRSQLLLPILFLFYQQSGLTAGDFFLFEGISSFISLLLLIPSGYIADFFSKKYILLLSFLLLLIKSFLWIFFHGYFIILLGTILNNVSKSLYFAAADSYIYEYLSYNKREKEMLNKYYEINKEAQNMLKRREKELAELLWSIKDSKFKTLLDNVIYCYFDIKLD